MVWFIVTLIALAIFCWYCLGPPNRRLVVLIILICVPLLAFPAAKLPFPYLVGIGVFLVLAAFVCYWVADPPAITNWDERSRVAAAVLLAAALMSFSFAKHTYELSRPPTLAEGYIVADTYGRYHNTITFQTLTGEVLNLYAYEDFAPQGIIPSKSALRRITYLPDENYLVLVEYQHGLSLISEYEDRKWHGNLWSFAAFLVFIFGIGINKARNGFGSWRGYTTGDPVAEEFTPEQPGEHWEVVTGPDGKEHFANPENRRPLGSPDIPPEAGA